MFLSKSAAVSALLLHFCFLVFTGWGVLLDVCSTCHVNATCEDKPDGRKVCNCMYGFVGNGRSHCYDKDECQIGAIKICGEHTACHNTHGSFYCTCMLGYSPSNNMDVFIPNDGTFCQDIDECAMIGICGEGAQCNNTPGDFQCHCQAGYQAQNGPEPFHPLRDRTLCNAIECGPPPPLPHAVLLSASGSGYLSVAHFGCLEGFLWKSGTDSARCGSKSVWEGASLVCEAIECGPPPSLAHTVLLSASGSSYRSVAQFGCLEGFQRKSGNDSALCGSEGLWEGPSLVCEEVDCGEPPPIPHTIVMWNGNSSMGNVVHYQCQEGFYNAGQDSVSVCTVKGRWRHVNVHCQEVDCGGPPPIPHALMLWNGNSSMGNVVHYQCQEGFYNTGKDSVSLCTARGRWEHVNIHCQEVDCGEPPSVSHAVMMWNGNSSMDTAVHYQCQEGFYNAGQGSVSVCTNRGHWSKAPILCEEVNCGKPNIIPHSKILWDEASWLGSVVYYYCEEGYYGARGRNYSLCEENGVWEQADLTCEALCGPAPLLPHAQVVWENGTVALHRCHEGYRSRRGHSVSLCGPEGVWQPATMCCMEARPAISRLHVFNSRCLRWRAELYEGGPEEYRIQFAGWRAYQWKFHDRHEVTFRSGRLSPEVCLELLPGSNYSINITALSDSFSVSISASTSIEAPPLPEVVFREVESAFPGLFLYRAHHTLDSISVYQVFVLPLEGRVVFNCSCPKSPHYDGSSFPLRPYVTAQIPLAGIGRELRFTVGDRQRYGGYYNAPLEAGREYYVILRALVQWGHVSKQTCVFWAKVRGTSYLIQSATVMAGGSAGLIAFLIFMGYSYNWYCKKRKQTAG